VYFELYLNRFEGRNIYPIAGWIEGLIRRKVKRNKVVTQDECFVMSSKPKEQSQPVRTVI